MSGYFLFYFFIFAKEIGTLSIADKRSSTKEVHLTEKQRNEIPLGIDGDGVNQ